MNNHDGDEELTGGFQFECGYVDFSRHASRVSSSAVEVASGGVARGAPALCRSRGGRACSAQTGRGRAAWARQTDVNTEMSKQAAVTCCV